MKKKLPAIAALLVLLAAYATYAGHRVEVFLDEAVSGLPSRLPGISLTLKERRGRIFYSVRTYRIYVAAGTFGFARPLEADIRVWAVGGPLSLIDRSIQPCLARVRATLLLTPDASPEVISFFGAFPDLLKSRLVLLLGIGGAVTASLDIPPAKRELPLKDARTLNLEWGGLTVGARFAPGLEAVEYDARAPRIMLADRGGSFECEGLSWTGRLFCGQGGAYHGRQALEAARASLLPKQGDSGLKLESPSITLDLIPKGETLDCVTRASFAAVTGGGEHASLRAGATIGNLDSAAVARFPALLRGLEAWSWENPRVREWASEMLKRSPWIALEASLTQDSPDERADAAVSLKAPELRGLPPHPMLALPDIRAEASFAAPPGLFARLLCAYAGASAGGQADRSGCANEAAAKLQALADQGFLLREGGRLRASGKWDGSALTLNGMRF